MKKNWIRFLCLWIILLIPIQAYALTPLEPDRACSLKLTYAHNGSGFPDLQIEAYRVAEAFPDGSFELISPFAESHANIHGITSQQEWKDTATTLVAHIAANQIRPDLTKKTDDKGVATFTGLETGLYLITEIQVENDTGHYIFDTFLVYLPTPLQPEGFDYDVEAIPKCSSYVPKTEYKVVKLWKDSGASGSRPSSVTIEIRKDTVLVETVTLKSANDWSYSWKVLANDTGKWTVSEKDVPSGYTVSISEKDATFTVTNTKQTTTTPPKTGDTFALRPWVMVLCLSGCGLLIIGTSQARRKKQ